MALALVDEIIRTGYEGIQSVYATVVNIATVVVNFLQPIFSFVWSGLQLAWNNFLQPIFSFLWGGIKRLASLGYNLLQLAWNNVLQPIFSFIWGGIKRLTTLGYNLSQLVWNNVLHPILNFAWSKIVYLAQLGLDLWDLLWTNVLEQIVETLCVIRDNIVLPILDVAGEMIAQMVALTADAMRFLYRTILVPLWPYIYRLAVNSIDLITRTPKFLLDCLNVGVNVVLAIIGLPVFIIKKCIGNNNVEVDHNENVLVGHPTSHQTYGVVPLNQVVVGAPIVNAYGNQQHAEQAAMPEAVTGQVPVPQRTSLDLR